MNAHSEIGSAVGAAGSLARSLQSSGQISITGLTGFDVSVVVRSCDPSCSDSLNGANKRIANEQFALAA